MTSKLIILTLILVLCTSCGADDETGSTETAEMSAAEMSAAETSAGEVSSPWGDVCVESTECSAPTDFCAKQPGMDEGYCTYTCTDNTQCADLDSPDSWSCNTLYFSGCEDLSSNWCGPISELTEFAGVIIDYPGG